MTPIDRAARAVKDARDAANSDPSVSWQDMDKRIARAVIAEIREPGEDMVEAGARQEFGLLVVEMWQDMIDALLAEGE
jgi:hypothetical protein